MYKIKITMIKELLPSNMKNPLYVDNIYYVYEWSKLISDHRNVLYEVIGKERYISTIKNIMNKYNNSVIDIQFHISDEHLLYIKLISEELFKKLSPSFVDNKEE